MIQKLVAVAIGAALMASASSALAQPTKPAASVVKQTPEGAMIDGNVVSGSNVIPSYHFYQPQPSADQDRTANRATVKRFFELPIGDERARLYATDGVKQIPGMGVQWIGLDAQLKNGQQNKDLFPGWIWRNVTIWDTQDPTVFWVEAEGSTAPGAKPEWSNHYVVQMVVKNAKISLFREFGTPVVLTP